MEEREAQSRWDIAVRAGLTPLVGRQEELSLLRRRWEQSKTGQDRLCCCGANRVLANRAWWRHSVNRCRTKAIDG